MSATRPALSAVPSFHTDSFLVETVVAKTHLRYHFLGERSLCLFHGDLIFQPPKGLKATFFLNSSHLERSVFSSELIL